MRDMSDLSYLGIPSILLESTKQKKNTIKEEIIACVGWSCMTDSQEYMAGRREGHFNWESVKYKLASNMFMVLCNMF